MFFIILMYISGSWISVVESCNGGSFRNVAHGGFSHLDHLDASAHPTLSEKIRNVLRSHYGWSGGTSLGGGTHGVSGGGASYRHTAGGAGGGGHHYTEIHDHDHDSYQHHEDVSLC